LQNWPVELIVSYFKLRSFIDMRLHGKIGTRVLKKFEGFSFVEIMVAVGLTGMISLGTVKIIDMMNRGQKNLTQHVTTNRLDFEIMMTLMDKSGCELTMNGITPPTVTGDSLTLADHGIIARGDRLITTTDSALPQNVHDFAQGGIMIHESTSILKDRDSDSLAPGDGIPNHYMLNLMFRKRASSVGADSIPVKIPLWVIQDNGVDGTITTCFTQEDAYVQAACASLLGTLEYGYCKRLQIFQSGVPVPAIPPADDNYSMSLFGNFFVNGEGSGAGIIFQDTLDDTEIDIRGGDFSDNKIAMASDRIAGQLVLNADNSFDSTKGYAKLFLLGNESVELRAPIYHFKSLDGGNTFLTVTDGPAVFNYGLTIAAGQSIGFASDKSQKKEISPLVKVLEKIEKISGVSFRWKDSNQKDIGVIAQDIEKVFPELVATNGEDGKLMVKYPQLSAVSIQAIKELHKENRYLLQEVQSLKKYLCDRDGKFCK